MSKRMNIQFNSKQNLIRFLLFEPARERIYYANAHLRIPHQSILFAIELDIHSFGHILIF